MHIYGPPLSPFVQRVLLGARLKGQEIALRAPPGGSLGSPEFQALSPMGRVPLLALDDGGHVCESGAILGYLDETLPGPALLPADPLARAHVRQIESLGMCEVAAPLRPLMQHLVFRRGDAPELVAAAQAQLARGLDALERVRGADDAFAAGPAPDRADCLLVPLFTLAGIVAGTGVMADPVAARPGLAAYRDRARAHPVLGRTFLDMESGFAAMLARLRAPPA